MKVAATQTAAVVVGPPDVSWPKQLKERGSQAHTNVS